MSGRISDERQVDQKQFNRRIKYRCCYRFTKGRRAGQLCGEWIDHYMRMADGEEFCIEHAYRRELKKAKP